MLKKNRNSSMVEEWRPKKVCYPSSLEDLRNEILSAKASGSKIRAAGSLHSFNDLCATTEIQIHTDKLNKVLAIDKANLKIRVEGGIKIANLLDILAEQDLTLPNQGYITKQSIAGAIATATHGSGKTGTMSSFVEEIELVDANGDLHILNCQTNDHLFSAALVNLGCLGIVYALTLRCIPLYKLLLTKTKLSLTEALERLPGILKECDHAMLYLDPYGEDALLCTYQKTEDNIRHRWRYRWKRLISKILATASFDYLPSPAWVFPILPKIYINFNSNFSCIDYSHQLLSPADEGTYVEEEIAIPIEYLKPALKEARELISQWGQNSPLMVGIIVVRFTGEDLKGYLSPSLKQSSAYLTYITVIKKGYRSLFKAFETSMSKYKGKPHWGKIHTLTKEKAAELYQDNYFRFLAAKHQLDPDGLFSNDYIERLFD